MLLKVRVRDEAGNPLPCRLTLTGPEGGAPVEEVCCAGEHLFAVPHGVWHVEARRGKLYRPAGCTVQPGQYSALAELMLERIVDPKALGLYSFDAHSHVARDDNSAGGHLATAALIMQAEDFNFFFAGSPYDADVHFQYLERDFSDRGTYREKYAALMDDVRRTDFILDIGNELVKCRYGHIFFLNYDQRPPFGLYYDEAYDHWVWNKQGDVPAYTIAYPHEAVQSSRGENSVAAVAHPTSWWRHDNGQFVTNIATSVGFDVLAGAADALVVLGYGSDKPAYQALWFDLLDNGYFLPGVAETDTAFDRLPGDFLRFKTYAWLDEFSIDALARAVRAGRCIASSGPLLTMAVDGQLPGSVLSFAPGQEFAISIQCFACSDGPLASVQIIVNGKVAAEYPAQGEQFAVEHKFAIHEDSYILAKCVDAAGNAAIASPVYVRNAPFVNQNYTACVRVEAAAETNPVSGCYWLDDGPRQPFEGGFQIHMSPAADLHVQAAGLERTVKLFELPELQRIFSDLYLGRFNADGACAPGEVPAGAFQVRRIREILDDVRLNLDFTNAEVRP